MQSFLGGKARLLKHPLFRSPLNANNVAITDKAVLNPTTARCPDNRAQNYLAANLGLSDATAGDSACDVSPDNGQGEGWGGILGRYFLSLQLNAKR